MARLPVKKESEGRLIVQLYPETWVKIGEVYVLFCGMNCGKAKLLIQAPDSVDITREDAKDKTKKQR